MDRIHRDELFKYRNMHNEWNPSGIANAQLKADAKDELRWLEEFSSIYGFEEEEMVVDRVAHLESIPEVGE